MEKVILFGIGKYFKHKEDILNRYTVSCILDNKIPKGQFEYYGKTDIKIINPYDLPVKGTDAIFLMSMHFVSMWKQLAELGINPCRLIYPYFEKPYFQSDQIVNKYTEQIRFETNRFLVEQKNGESRVIHNEEEWNDYLRFLYRLQYPLISAISQMETDPISEQFGSERGTPIDRFYIDQFLMEHKDYIRGTVLEIEDSFYTKKFGGDHVEKSIVMDVSSSAPEITFNGNLETGEGIRDNIADCFILTQTLMYIYDLKMAVKNIYKCLKKNGVVLITCSGLSQNSQRCMDSYGAYYNFNEDVFKKLFVEEEMEVLEIGSFGNVKTVSAHINGLCCEDLTETDFVPNDKYYPLIVYAVVRKNG